MIRYMQQLCFSPDMSGRAAVKDTTFAQEAHRNNVMCQTWRDIYKLSHSPVRTCGRRGRRLREQWPRILPRAHERCRLLCPHRTPKLGLAYSVHGLWLSCTTCADSERIG